jgi:tRNA(Ile2) C34 agmatinyltransferase TiaS
MIQISDEQMRGILKRRDALYKLQPKCSECGSDQTQLMGSQPPAKWRCRRCKYRFTLEPKT